MVFTDPNLKTRLVMLKMTRDWRVLIANPIKVVVPKEHESLVRKMASTMTPNVQKLRRPEPAAQNNQKAHSQIRSANEGLPPALC